MKSICLYGPGNLRSHYEFELRVHEEQAMVHKVAGTRGSDLHRFFVGEIGDARLQRQLVRGYESAKGIVDGNRETRIGPPCSNGVLAVRTPEEVSLCCFAGCVGRSM